MYESASFYSRSFKAYERVWILLVCIVLVCILEYEFAPIFRGSNLTAGKCPNIYY